MASKVVCDGSTVEWEPVLEENHCYECGNVTGHTDTAEPDFHGPSRRTEGGKWACSRCGMEFLGLEATTRLLVEKLSPAVTKVVEETSLFYEAIARTRRR